MNFKFHYLNNFNSLVKVTFDLGVNTATAKSNMHFSENLLLQYSRKKQMKMRWSVHPPGQTSTNLDYKPISQTNPSLKTHSPASPQVRP